MEANLAETGEDKIYINLSKITIIYENIFAEISGIIYFNIKEYEYHEEGYELETPSSKAALLKNTWPSTSKPKFNRLLKKLMALHDEHFTINEITEIYQEIYKLIPDILQYGYDVQKKRIFIKVIIKNVYVILNALEKRVEEKTNFDGFVYSNIKSQKIRKSIHHTLNSEYVGLSLRNIYEVYLAANTLLDIARESAQENIYILNRLARLLNSLTEFLTRCFGELKPNQSFDQVLLTQQDKSPHQLTNDKSNETSDVRVAMSTNRCAILSYNLFKVCIINQLSDLETVIIAKLPTTFIFTINHYHELLIRDTTLDRFKCAFKAIQYFLTPLNGSYQRASAYLPLNEEVPSANSNAEESHSFSPEDFCEFKIFIRNGKLVSLSISRGTLQYLPFNTKQHISYQREGFASFIVTTSGQIHAFSYQKPDMGNGQHLIAPHILIAKFAGEIKTDMNGKIIAITTYSTDYITTERCLDEFIDFLMKQNVDLSDCTLYIFQDSGNRISININSDSKNNPDQDRDDFYIINFSSYLTLRRTFNNQTNKLLDELSYYKSFDISSKFDLRTTIQSIVDDTSNQIFSDLYRKLILLFTGVLRSRTENNTSQDPSMTLYFYYLIEFAKNSLEDRMQPHHDLLFDESSIYSLFNKELKDNYTRIIALINSSKSEHAKSFKLNPYAHDFQKLCYSIQEIDSQYLLLKTAYDKNSNAFIICDTDLLEGIYKFLNWFKDKLKYLFSKSVRQTETPNHVSVARLTKSMEIITNPNKHRTRTPTPPSDCNNDNLHKSYSSL